MRGVLGGIVAALFASGLGYGAEPEAAAAKVEDASANFLFFSGADLWAQGAFVHGGLLWSPAGLDREGFTLKLLTGAGTYRYVSGALGGTQVTGRVALGALMPGWRFKHEGLELTLFGGLDVQDHQLSPDDPSNRLRGTHFGARLGADLWYEPLADLMVAANASVSSIGPTYWTRAATGLRVFDRLWLGPEALALGDTKYRDFRFGLHATALKTGELEWSAGAGWVTDSDRRSGAYGRLSVLMRH